MEQLLRTAMDTNATMDHATVVRRSSAANPVSIAARHEVINFGRNYADFVPGYVQGWNPDPITKKLPSQSPVPQLSTVKRTDTYVPPS